MVKTDMRKIGLAALIALMLIGVFQLTTMSFEFGGEISMSARQGMSGCQMGFICPAQYESFRQFGTVSTASSLGLLPLLLALAFTLLAALLIDRTSRAAPLWVRTDTGPPALRSILKKE